MTPNPHRKTIAATMSAARGIGLIGKSLLYKLTIDSFMQATQAV